ncbi:MAG: hypothetical protein CL862_06775 [Cyanobium sp. NAT70]|nr:hypothetical protein [Cyanobium sp. NAT70]
MACFQRWGSFEAAFDQELMLLTHTLLRADSRSFFLLSPQSMQCKCQSCFICFCFDDASNDDN